MKGTMRLWAVGVLGAGSLLLSQALSAMDGDWVWHVNTGYADTVGQTKDYLKGGWTLGGGFAFQPDDWEHLALQFDLGFSYMDANHDLIALGNQRYPVRIDDGHGAMAWATVAGKYHVDFTDVVRGYGLLGVGGYHRYIELTQTALFVGTVCDPWWGYCYPGTYYGQSLVASQSTFKFGYDAGIGVEFQTSGAGVWFIEARYHRMEGSHPTELLPIQFGLRF